MSRLEVASGTFQVPIFIDVGPDSGLAAELPDFVSSERITGLYEGQVDATVDLSGLDASDVTIDEEANAITIRVPEPVLGPPRINRENSEIIAHERGVVQRFEDAVGDTNLDMAALDEEAEGKIAQAARESDLPRMARDNGAATLEQLGQAMGYDEVTVEYRPGIN